MRKELLLLTSLPGKKKQNGKIRFFQFPNHGFMLYHSIRTFSFNASSKAIYMNTIFAMLTKPYALSPMSKAAVKTLSECIFQLLLRVAITAIDIKKDYCT